MGVVKGLRIEVNCEIPPARTGQPLRLDAAHFAMLQSILRKLVRCGSSSLHSLCDRSKEDFIDALSIAIKTLKASSGGHHKW
eukprot:6490089-Amphidinium_carterae.3